MASLSVSILRVKAYRLWLAKPSRECSELVNQSNVIILNDYDLKKVDTLDYWCFYNCMLVNFVFGINF
jgi:hypothetical protein